jgi:hypothetical protein
MDGRALSHEPINLSAFSNESGKLLRSWSLETDADGRFEPGDLMPATYVATHVLHFGPYRADDLARTVKITEARVYELELKPRGNCRLNGTVVADGDLAPFVPVEAMRKPDPGGKADQRRTMARNGHFELEGLEPGHWHISAYEPNSPWKTGRQGSADIDVRPDHEANVVIELHAR